MKLHPVLATLALSLSVLLSGCASTPDQASQTTAPTESAKVATNDFPTRDRVEYVLNCVAKHGGLSYINQYACGCKIDKIAEQLTFQEYDEARTFTMLQNTTGEKAAVFRDPKQSKTLRDRLKEAETVAEKACFVK